MERTTVAAPTAVSIPFEEVVFFHSGSTVLDQALGGGWACKRIFNLVGDKSTGKTLIAIEAFANFHRKFSTGRMRYGESEAAFNASYASTLGFPAEVERPANPLATVEEFYADIKTFAEAPTVKGSGIPKDTQALYILDSLDALSDTAEMDRELDEKTYGANKAAQLSKLFRKENNLFAISNVTLGIVSQVRENIGVTWGDGLIRSGGKALDFYASQVVWLNEVGKIEKEYRGQKRPIGVDVRARVKKNKVGLPFREAFFGLLFSYGIDDETSMLEWLADIKAIKPEEAKAGLQALEKAREARDREELNKISNHLKEQVKKEWKMIDEYLAPKVRKYT